MEALLLITGVLGILAMIITDEDAGWSIGLVLGVIVCVGSCIAANRPRNTCKVVKSTVDIDKYNYKYFINGTLVEESNELEPLLDKCQKLTRAGEWRRDHPDETLLEGGY